MAFPCLICDENDVLRCDGGLDPPAEGSDCADNPCLNTPPNCFELVVPTADFDCCAGGANIPGVWGLLNCAATNQCEGGLGAEPCGFFFDGQPPACLWMSGVRPFCAGDSLHTHLFALHVDGGDVTLYLTTFDTGAGAPCVRWEGVTPGDCLNDLWILDLVEQGGCASLPAQLFLEPVGCP
jgi:hypothetical protein